MELQVLCAILPISQIASIPSCIHFVSTLLPLEDVFSLRSFKGKDDAVLQDKRTWRPGTGPSHKNTQVSEKWTAMEIMTAYADKKGWVTAKAGRPDVNRAGNAS